MITNGDYVKYDIFPTAESVWEFLNKGIIYSKIENFRDEITKLVEYKKANLYSYKQKEGRRKYENIFAHSLEILIPKCISDDQYDQFIHKYIINLDKRFKNLLYVYKKATRHDARYCIVMLFPRYVYKKKHYRTQKWTFDYWWNPITKRRSTEKDEKAILRHKKGDVKLDKDGKPIRKLLDVKAKAERVFTYSSFRKFSNRLKEKLLLTTTEFEGGKGSYKRISKITVNSDDSKLVKKLKIKRNSFIEGINRYLFNYQESAVMMRAEDWLNEKLDDFYIAVNRMIHVDKIEGHKVLSFVKEWWIKNVANEVLD